MTYLYLNLNSAARISLPDSLYPGHLAACLMILHPYHQTRTFLGKLVDRRHNRFIQRSSHWLNCNLYFSGVSLKYVRSTRSIISSDQTMLVLVHLVTVVTREFNAIHYITICYGTLHRLWSLMQLHSRYRGVVYKLNSRGPRKDLCVTPYKRWKIDDLEF